MAFHFSDQNFAAEAKTGFALVDFFAEWCGPCKMMAPFIDQLATEYEGKVKIGKLDVDENQETGQAYAVQSIPTLVFLKNGEEVGRLVGFQSKDVLVGQMKELFGV